MHKRTLRVHSVAEQPIPVLAKVGDREISANLPGLVVELVDPNGDAHQLKFAQSSDNEHKDTMARLKKPGATVEVQYTIVDGAA